MRTTVTLDPEVEQLLRLATYGSQQSFKAALIEARAKAKLPS